MKLPLSCCIWLLLSSFASAQLLVNGTMEPATLPINVNSHNDETPAGWTAFGISTPDTFSPSTTFFEYTFPTNPGSGFFTHLSAIGGLYSEGLYQTVAGATPGLLHTLSFDQAIDLSIFGTEGGAFRGNLAVTVDGVVYQSPMLTAPSSWAGSSGAWQRHSIQFTPGSGSFQVQFVAISESANERVDLGLDNITLSVVPEPETACLAGMAALVASRMRRRRSPQI